MEASSVLGNAAKKAAVGSRIRTGQASGDVSWWGGLGNPSTTGPSPGEEAADGEKPHAPCSRIFGANKDLTAAQFDFI